MSTAKTASKLMQEFYVSPAYDPKSARHADVVEAAINFALTSIFEPTSDMVGDGFKTLNECEEDGECFSEAAARIWKAMHKAAFIEGAGK